jgi:molybdopterin molybdotransferase
VVAIEQTESSGGDVMVKVAIEAGRNLLPTGADIAAGRLLVPAGRRIGPREVTALASYGVVSVPVFARPRVAVLSSGAEVRPAHELPGPAGVRDSNQPMLAALAEAAGCQVTRAGLVADQPEALSAALAGLLGAHDVLILSAGTSVGRRDFALDAIASLPGARVLLHGLDIRPGKPTIAAVVEDGSRMRVLFGVPGFPVSAAVVFEAFVHDVLARMAGESGFRPWPVRVPVTMAAPHQSARGREDYLRVRFCDGPDRTGRRLVEPTPGGPANVSNFLDTDAVVIVAPETERLEAGQDVEAGLWG